MIRRYSRQYDQVLTSERQRALRLEVICRAGYRCIACGRGGVLDVHHAYGCRNLGDATASAGAWVAGLEAEANAILGGPGTLGKRSIALSWPGRVRPCKPSSRAGQGTWRVGPPEMGLGLLSVEATGERGCATRR